MYHDVNYVMHEQKKVRVQYFNALILQTPVYVVWVELKI